MRKEDSIPKFDGKMAIEILNREIDRLEIRYRFLSEEYVWLAPMCVINGGVVSELWTPSDNPYDLQSMSKRTETLIVLSAEINALKQVRKNFQEKMIIYKVYATGEEE